MIRYLKQEEKGRTKALYETCFPEDSPDFADYYYTHRILDNRILVLEDASTAEREGEKGPFLQAMVHLNPYHFSFCGQETEAPYVVAVATDQRVRRQGKMFRVLTKALCDMAKEGHPFAFLIPANPAVYRSGGFVFISSEQYEEYRKQQEIIPVCSKGFEKNLQAAELTAGRAMQAVELWRTRNAPPGESLNRKEHMFYFRKADGADIPGMIAFSDRFLQQNYDVFLRKTEADHRRMLAEMECENGGVLLLTDAMAGERAAGEEEGNSIRGILSYGTADDVLELKELLISKEDREIARQLLARHFPRKKIEIPGMNFMVRILDLRTLVPMLRSHEGISCKVRVQDPVIETNQGSFWIRVNRERGSIVPIPQEDAEETVEIGELAARLFAGLRVWIREWV